MPKVTMTIEDLPDGKVKCVLNPSAETLLKKQASGHVLSSAEGYLIFCANKLRECANSQSNIIVKVPRIGRI